MELVKSSSLSEFLALKQREFLLRTVGERKSVYTDWYCIYYQGMDYRGELFQASSVDQAACDLLFFLMVDGCGLDDIKPRLHRFRLQRVMNITLTRMSESGELFNDVTTRFIECGNAHDLLWVLDKYPSDFRSL